MHFVLIALGGFCTFQTEIMISESEFQGNRTFPAGAARIF